MDAVTDDAVVLVEIIDSHGHVRLRERQRLGTTRRRFTIGRSLEADVVLDDAHAAPLHAVIELTADSRLTAGDLGTINGIVVDRIRRHDPAGIAVGQTPIRIGRTLVRLRSSTDPLAPELVDRHEHRLHVSSPAMLAAVALVIATGYEIYAVWLRAPRDLTAAFLSTVALKAAVLAAWVAAWSLISRIVIGEWRWLHHTAIALGISVAMTLVQTLVGMTTFAWALPTWRDASIWITVIAIGVALYLHLRNASVLPRPRAVMIAAIAPLLLGLATTWFYDRISRDDVRRISTPGQIYPPYLRLRTAEPADAFFAAAGSLKAEADRRSKPPASDDDGNINDTD